MEDLREAVRRLRDNDAGLVKLELNGIDRKKIGNEGAGEIAKSLKGNSVLVALELGYNNITAVGARQIADAIKVNKVLTRLDLWCNFIRAKGARMMAEALKFTDVLASLFLSNWQRRQEQGGRGHSGGAAH